MHTYHTWTYMHAYLPGFGLWRSIERKVCLDPAIYATQCHHLLGRATDGQHDERRIRKGRLIGIGVLPHSPRPRIIVELLSTRVLGSVLFKRPRPPPLNSSWSSVGARCGSVGVGASLLLLVEAALVLLVQVCEVCPGVHSLQPLHVCQALVHHCLHWHR